MTDTTQGKPESTGTLGGGLLVTRSPIYYGWVILAAGVVGRIMTSPGQTYSVSIFIDHFIGDLRISRSLVSTLYTVGTLVGSLALPFVGRLIDERGPRVMVGVIAALFALACGYMALVRNALMLGIGFALIRMLGQGSLGLVSTNVINQWWVQRRGAILGIAGVLSSLLGSGAFPSLVHALIGHFGWRLSYLALGVMVAVVTLPAGLVFFRRRPEDFGLLPDGAEASTLGRSFGRQTYLEENWTSSEAIRTTAFWTIGMGLASMSMLSTGLQFHMVSIFEDGGLSASAAAAAFGSIALTSAAVRIASGLIVDHVPVRFLLFAALLSQAASLVMAPRLRNGATALSYGVVLGITSGLQLTVSAVIWAKYFGRRHLGSITGMASLVLVGGSALGPMPMGIARDIFGSYGSVLTASSALPLLLAIAVLSVRRPRRGCKVSVDDGMGC
jgi:MFS family permease